MFKLRSCTILIVVALTGCEQEIDQKINQEMEQLFTLEIQTESNIQSIEDCYNEMQSQVGIGFEGTACQVCASFSAYPGDTITLYGVAYFHGAAITGLNDVDYNVAWTILEGDARLSIGNDPRESQLILPGNSFDKVVIRLENLAPNGLIVSESLTIRNASLNIEVSDPGQAGRVVFDKGLYADDWRYLEATNGLVGSNFAENRFEMEWGCGDQEIGITGLEVGDGKLNSAKIVQFMNDISGYREDPDVRCSSLNDGTVSAWAIDAYPNNGFSDWHLPSLEEARLVAQNLGWLSENPNVEATMLIWTSSEVDNESAYAVDLYSGETFVMSKDNNLRAVGVRYF